MPRTCENGHPLDPGVTECPWCPKGRSRLPKPRIPTLQAEQPNPKRVDTAEPPRRRVRSPTLIVESNVAPTPAPATSSRRSAPTMWVDDPALEPEPTPTGTTVPSLQPNYGSTPLVGFLISTSNDANGQFWPLRVGRTQIGPGDADVVVRGATETVTLEITGNAPPYTVRTESSGPPETLANGDTVDVAGVRFSLVLA